MRSKNDSDVQAPTPRRPAKPILWIVAGPNGSGKSSLYNRTDIEGWGGSVWIINPDLLTSTIVDRERLGQDEANLAAVGRIEHWLDASVATYQTIGVETVLSTGKYRSLVELARRRGFEVRMIYVVLRTLAMQLERIAIRVDSGGHDVPREKVAARRQRSFDQFAWFVRNVDECFVFDNSGGSPTLAASWNGVSLDIFATLPQDLLLSLKGAGVPGVHHLG